VTNDRSIHLACDTGEAPPGPARRREHELLGYASMVFIACGGHAGDEASMSEAVEAATRAGCAIGAHPSYPDREQFGRRSLDMPPAGLERSIRDQLAAFREVAVRSGASVVAIKPHGALYHDASNDREIAGVVAIASREVFPDAPLVVPAGSVAFDGRTIREAFADRRYEPDGSLRPRAQPNAVIEDPAEAAAQALSIAATQTVRTADGTALPLRASVLCVHGDTPNAVEIAAAVRAALIDARFRLGD